MKFFSVDGPVYKFMSKLWITVKINLCWLLFSLPIITIGASTVAAYTIALKVVRDEEGHIFRPFVKAFAKNFWQGTVAWIFNVIVAFAIYYDFQLSALDGMSDLMTMLFFCFGIVCTFFMLLSMLYTYPLIARYENKLLATIKNSISVAFQFFGSTLVLLVLLVVEICFFLWNYTTWFIAAIIGPGLVILTVSYYARNIFGIIELDPENIREAKKMKSRKNTDFDPEASGCEYTPVYDDDRILIMPEDDELEDEETVETEQFEEAVEETEEAEENAQDSCETEQATETSNGEES